MVDDSNNITRANGEMKQLPLAFVRGEAVIEKPQDLFIPPDALEVILESFEGPLDLLLYLIKKQKFDIIDLPIAPITTQYMHYVELMRVLNIELAAEYLVMAAILAEIKSRLLLPKPELVEDEEDPRAELVRRLAKYQAIKQAAVALDELPRMERDLLTAQVGFPNGFISELQQADVELGELVQALQQVLKRSEAYEHHHIAKESLSTRERMSEIMQTLAAQNQYGFVNFTDLFKFEEGRHGVVVTFLAILELIKESLIECQQLARQENTAAEIQVRLKESLHVVE